MIKLQGICLFITWLGLVSCMPLGRISKKGKDTGDYCAPALRYVYDSTYLPLSDVQAIIKTDTSFLGKYSRHDLLMANATGILPLLKELSQLEGKQDDDSQLERVKKRQQIQSRLLLASTEIASFAAELDCEGERAEQLATYLDQKDNKRIRKLTIVSVVIGAVTTVATALIQADNTSKVVGVAGGLVSAATGGLAAFSSNQTIPYMHKRNLLADLWTQPKESSIYPPFIWYVLNEKSFSNSGQTSIAYNIRQRWKDYMLEDSSQEEQVLYFSEGGNYQADDLHVRANMINQLQSSIRSINQDLQSLALSLGDK